MLGLIRKSKYDELVEVLLNGVRILNGHMIEQRGLKLMLAKRLEKYVTDKKGRKYKRKMHCTTRTEILNIVRRLKR